MSPFRDNRKPFIFQRAGSQYIVSVSSQPEAINISMGIDATKRWNRIGFLAFSPIEKLMASGCDETETIYCEPAFLVYNISCPFRHNRKPLIFQWALTLGNAGIGSVSIPAFRSVNSH